MYKKILLLFILCFLRSFSYGQKKTVDSLIKIIEQQRPELGQALCTEDFWIADNYSGQIMFKKLCRKKINVKIDDYQIFGYRAVFTLILNSEKHPPSIMYCYLYKDKEWLIDGLNNVKNMPEYYLEGKCDGYFFPSQMPSDSAYLQLGESIVDHATNKEKLESFFDEYFYTGNQNDTPEEIIDLFTAPIYTNLRFVNTAFSNEMNRGYLRFELTYEENKTEYTTIYFEPKNSSMFRFLGYTNGNYLSITTFFH